MVTDFCTALMALEPFAAVGGLIAGFYAVLTLPGELAVAGGGAFYAVLNSS